LQSLRHAPFAPPVLLKSIEQSELEGPQKKPKEVGAAVEVVCPEQAEIEGCRKKAGPGR
jgi:hypothetical protein